MRFREILRFLGLLRLSAWQSYPLVMAAGTLAGAILVIAAAAIGWPLGWAALAVAVLTLTLLVVQTLVAPRPWRPVTFNVILTMPVAFALAWAVLATARQLGAG